VSVLLMASSGAALELSGSLYVIAPACSWAAWARRAPRQARFSPLRWALCPGWPGGLAGLSGPYNLLGYAASVESHQLE